MCKRIYIENGKVINEGRTFFADIMILDDKIEHIIENTCKAERQFREKQADEVIDAEGMLVLPGIIDDQVHFREPGLTHKGDIYSESKAAVAGGVTSFMEMPNCNPPTLTQELLEEKYEIGARRAFANYSFYMGASNDNIEEVLKTDPTRVCGIKVFMGASTGNMLVDNKETLNNIFEKAPCLVAVHCEDENTIRKNSAEYKEKYGEDVPIACHPEIRSEEACYLSSSLAVELAKKHNTRLHVLHLSTAKEMSLFEKGNLNNKNITAEACVHHLWFSDKDYEKLGTSIKWNPAIKKESDRDALWKALLEDKLDVIATDHAPHTTEEKSNTYFKAPSGGPLVQHSLVMMLEAVEQGKLTYEKVVEKMCHAVADCYQVKERGYLREGYKADIVLVNPNNNWTVNSDNILYKCKWSPLEGESFKHKVEYTLINGNIIYNKGKVNEIHKGERLLFNR
ncbi:MAG: dihydroorotase [Hyphomicrobiales bacterium]